MVSWDDIFSIVPLGTLVYGIPVFLATLYAVYKQEKNSIIVGSVLLSAFIVTKSIPTIENRYMLDMLNDLAVMVVLLFWLGKENLLVRCLAVTYAAMTFGGYIPVAVGEMTNDTKAIVLEALGILHIIVIIGGTKYGPHIRDFENIRNRNISNRGVRPDVVRPVTGMRSSFDKDGTIHIKGDI